MKISKIFELAKTQYELDFIDIDVKLDKRLFVDPIQISRIDAPWSRDATDTIGSFFQFLITLLRNGREEDAFKLFSNLGEPNETCLGMSRGEPEGKGVGREDSRKIFESLYHSKAIQSGLVNDIEDCVIFVENFGPDKLSDMTTNIIRGHLLDYTKEQCRLWNIPLQPSSPTGKIWNKNELHWEEKYDETLIIDGHRILLVPKNIVSIKSRYRADIYHKNDVLEFLQEEELSLHGSLVQYRSNKGKNRGIAYVTKKSLEETKAPFSKEFLIDFTLKHKEVFEKYKIDAKEKTRVVENREIDSEEDLALICKSLIEELKGIESGSDQASDFHRLITGILELAFYPQLSRPKIEQRIHSGRKRIDIVFNNSAKEGFFASAPERFQIPVPLISVECKNYSDDPQNPELDQLAGRFSPQRGQLGILICRKFISREPLFQRCADHWSDKHGLILPFCDEDFLLILNAIEGKTEFDINDFLYTRASEIIKLS